MIKLPLSGGYDDFSYPTRTRRDRVCVNGREFYVNMGYLAEFSDFFADRLDESGIMIEGIESVDFLELLRVLCNCPRKKPLSEANIIPVVNAACFFGVSHVLKRCEEVIQYCLNTLSHADLVHLTQTISKYDRDNASLSLLVDKIAHFNENELYTLPFNKIPGDVVADVYTVRHFSTERERKRKAERGRFWSTGTCCCFF